MKAFKLSKKAEAAVLGIDEGCMAYYWNPLANKIIEASPCLEGIDHIELLIDLIIDRYIDIDSNYRKSQVSSDSDEADPFDSKITDKIYNLTEAAREMRVSEKFLRKGLKLGYFFGEKTNGRWRIDFKNHNRNLNMLQHLLIGI